MKSEVAARYGTQTAPGRFIMPDEPVCSSSSSPVPDEYGASVKKNISTQQMGLRTTIPNSSTFSRAAVDQLLPRYSTEKNVIMGPLASAQFAKMPMREVARRRVCGVTESAKRA